MAEPKTYASAQEAVNDLVPGARLVGQIPFYITEPIPVAEQERNGPTTRSVQRGLELSIIGPDGEPDKIVIGPSYEQKEGEPIPVGATVTWNNTPGAPLPPATIVLKGPTKGPSATTAATPGTPIAQWDRLDANGQVITDPTKPATFIRDPKAPATTPPFKVEAGNETGDPSQWETKVIAGATIVYDPIKKAVVATVPAKADAAPQRTGVYDDMIDPNDPTGKRVIAKVDQGSKEVYTVAREPKSQKQVVTTPNKVFVFDEDGSVLNTIDITPDKAPVLVPMGNTVYVFDPATKTFTKGPEVEEPATVGLSTQNEWYIFFDKNGNEVNRVKNPSWTGHPQTAQPPTSLTAPKVPKWNPKTGEWDYVPNEGRLTIGEVTQAMIKDLTGQTVDPNNPLTLDEANTILTTAINRMNTEAQQAQTAGTAAGNMLTNIQQGATTGAGILQNRVANTQNFIQQGLNVATSTGGRYGNYSGGMLSPVPGLGQALVGGAQAYATELGGGQAVYDTAVRMVQAADPNNSNPDRAAAVATLTQIMDRYRQTTGRDYPTVAATKALAASNAANGAVAPQTVNPAAVAPEVFQAQFDPRLNPAAPQQPANTLLPAGVAGTVAPGSPTYLGTLPTVTQPRSAEALGFTAPDLFAQAGIGGMGYR